MNKGISSTLIHKYIDGRCTTEEAEAVHSWYASFEDKPDPLIDLELKEQLELKMRMRNKVMTNIDLATIQHKKTRNKLLWYKWVGAAAILIGVLGMIFFWPNLSSEQTDLQAGTIKPSNQIMIRNTTSGMLKNILSDGSVVWLSPLSSISYRKNFESESRKVSLIGDAFFEVTKDKRRPFIIYGGEVITKVWGTSFSISYDAVSKATEVAVLTGKVSVRPEMHHSQEVLLLPNQKAVYARTENKLSKKNIVKGSGISIWKRENVVFDHLTVNQIAKVLNAKFDVNIEVADATLNAAELKADFTGQSLPEILLIMEKSLNIRYAIEGKNIILYSNNQNNQI